MRPVLIPDEQIPEGAQRLTIMPPGNDLESDISPVEAVLLHDSDGRHVFGVRWALEPGDLEKLQAGQTVWTYLMTDQMPPVDVQIEP